ncbi:MAG: (2Fe-2S)-binding protein [Spirochaetales bacterium]|uniref:(2Fe-2S)-binding protein n=1 Tax=Candidatus Thalassospirochaeta sargassi TaxID=3119039 RepID=A0AAJ1ID51_9SPIO|nr:(2Fe-2S)-binding protein [Spirochaetales bacterium]
MNNLLIVNYVINGKDVVFTINPKDSLLKVLRDNGYTEVHNGCQTGDCGACVVILNGRTVNSCMVLAASAKDGEILTVKALGDIHNPHPIQRAFAESGAVQCGFCTPGQILSTYALLLENHDPDEKDIRRALDGNICRCTGYVKILEAVKLAGRLMKEAEHV